MRRSRLDRTNTVSPARLLPMFTPRLVQWDLRCLLTLHAAARHDVVMMTMRLASRLGDGVVWYVLMLLLAAWQELHGLRCALHMLGTAIAGLICYRWMKRRTGRPRPYATQAGVMLYGRALDEFSFPSGHTLHAVAFTIVLATYFPHVALALTPLVILIALSRVVLGLHYPSDVLAGALTGALLAFAGIFGMGFVPVTS